MVSIDGMLSVLCGIMMRLRLLLLPLCTTVAVALGASLFHIDVVRSDDVGRIADVATDPAVVEQPLIIAEDHSDDAWLLRSAMDRAARLRSVYVSAIERPDAPRPPRMPREQVGAVAAILPPTTPFERTTATADLPTQTGFDSLSASTDAPASQEAAEPSVVAQLDTDSLAQSPAADAVAEGATQATVASGSDRLAALPHRGRHGSDSMVDPHAPIRALARGTRALLQLAADARAAAPQQRFASDRLRSPITEQNAADQLMVPAWVLAGADRLVMTGDTGLRLANLPLAANAPLPPGAHPIGSARAQQDRLARMGNQLWRARDEQTGLAFNPTPTWVVEPLRRPIDVTEENTAEATLALFDGAEETPEADEAVEVAEAEAPATEEVAEGEDGTLIRTVRVEPGITPYRALIDLGVDAGQALSVFLEGRSDFDPRRLRVGQEIEVAMRRGPAGLQVVAMRLREDDGRPTVTVAYNGEAFESIQRDEHTTRDRRFHRVVIRSSPYADAAADGVPSSVLDAALTRQSWPIDFRRDVHRGDVFEILYEAEIDSRGREIGAGDVLFARFDLGQEEAAVYRFERPDGSHGLYDPDGTVRRTELRRMPVNGRVSSRFGRRFHPVHRVWREHTGVDIAAARGTPILASGSGRITTAARQRGYGNIIEIQHNNRLRTRYAHMTRFADGMRVGTQVDQGDVIGYVGCTGWCTGPHVHYEVLVNGTQVDPLGQRFALTEGLDEDELRQFRTQVAEIDRLIERYSETRQYASTEGAGN